MQHIVKNEAFDPRFGSIAFEGGFCNALQAFTIQRSIGEKKSTILFVN